MINNSYEVHYSNTLALNLTLFTAEFKERQCGTRDS